MIQQFGINPDQLPKHTHETPSQGGDLADYLRLGRAAPQEMVGDLVVGGTVAAAGANLTGALALPDLNTTPIQSTAAGPLICLDGAVAVTAAREWLRPDTDGEYVMSKPTVALVNQAATATGNVLVAPDAGHYAFLVYVENRTALAAGTILAAIAHTGAGGALTQSPLLAMALTARGAQSFVVICKVASGDVTYSFTVAAAVGTPSYDASVVPLGRFA